jgi:3-deoxy-D-manno-octulosonic acid kinase
MIQELFAASGRGGILYDALRLRKPDDALFSREYWAGRGGLAEVAGGRSSIAVLRVDSQTDLQPDSSQWVLRHYRRGGLIAKLSADRYVWLGAARTRSFAEWRLLAELRRRGLPVPAPIAARYVRGTLTYQADLITQLIPASRTLADSIAGAELAEPGWRAVGRTIAAFHREGVQHADLNANNILLSAGSSADAPAVHLLDFDRGRLRARGSWENAVLERLKRSLEKVQRQRSDVRFGETQWQWLKQEATRDFEP